MKNENGDQRIFDRIGKLRTVMAAR
jgi:hypothetical protein